MLGNSIKTIRESRRMSQATLARHADVTPHYISLLETGRRNPSIQTLNNFATALGVPVAVFTVLGSKIEPDSIATDEFTALQDAILEEIQKF